MAVLSFAPLQFVASIPPATRAFTAVTIAFSLLYYFLAWTSNDDFSVPYLVLVPGSSIFYPWTFLTSAFVETNVIEVRVSPGYSSNYAELLSAYCNPPSNSGISKILGTSMGSCRDSEVHCGVYHCVEHHCLRTELVGIYGAWEPCVLVSQRSMSLYVCTSYTNCRYGQWYHGQMALQVAILVAFTQIIPEHQVQLFGVLKARTLPMAYVTFSTVMCLIGFQCPFIVIQFGWLVSYIWLRFYKKNTGDVVSGGPTYGDRSETFAFVSWFPPFIHVPITLLANTAHSLATRFHVIPTAGLDVESGGYSQLPGGARAEAERRRAMALKALDQRLAGNAPGPSPPKANGPAVPPSRPANGESSVPRPPPAAISSDSSKESDVGAETAETR
nr:hypothesis protein 2 [Mycoleptodonoides aitchisonii]